MRFRLMRIHVRRSYEITKDREIVTRGGIFQKAIICEKEQE